MQDINNRFEFGNELLDSLSGPALGTFLMAAEMAAGDKPCKYHSLYCSEYDTNTLTAGQIYNMPEPVVQTTVSLYWADGEHKGKYYGYACISIGVDWFSWGIGDPLMSALCEYFGNENFVPPEATPCEQCSGEATEPYKGQQLCDGCAYAEFQNEKETNK